MDATAWDPIVSDWIGLVVRWVHLITGIAWIGASFYFIHLDASLRQSGSLPAGVGGEAWQVHGGGFYRMQKYLVAPAELPKELTWFKYEAYSTWLSGFVLLGLIYYLSADLYLIDRAIMDLPVWAAVLISVPLTTGIGSSSAPYGARPGAGGVISTPARQPSAARTQGRSTGGPATCLGASPFALPAGDLVGRSSRKQQRCRKPQRWGTTWVGVPPLRKRLGTPPSPRRRPAPLPTRSTGTGSPSWAGCCPRGSG
jgi:hypothetical protein